MQPSLKKRFWTDAKAAAFGDAWEILLDDRRVMTPAKSHLLLPNAALAEAVAAEWQAQEGDVMPATMPMTRRANAALDKVAVQHAEVADMLAEYAASDLLCHRAASPQELVARQAAAWDPLLDWIAKRYDAPLVVTEGVMPAAQPADSLSRLRQSVHGYDNFALTALHDLVTLPGSLVIGLAASSGEFDAGKLWRASQVDEDWQAGLWGIDEEAAQNSRNRAEGFSQALRFLALVRGG
ncbi:MAG: ATPase [Rhodobacteraceae bacterium]|nr:ATPase [Paracoccaceae bacterium]